MAVPRAGAAYLALVTGAPVVPVSFLGTRVPGGHSGSVPQRGSRLAMTFGDPVHLDASPVAAHPGADGRRGRSGARPRSIETMREAEQVTGMHLPGPLGPKPEKKPEKQERRAP